MATMLHGSARTTPRIRAELQRSKEKTSLLAQRYGLSCTTITKWRSRTATADAPVKTQKHRYLACRGGGNRGVPVKNAAAPGRRDGLPS